VNLQPSTPNIHSYSGKLLFDPVTIPAHGQVSYTITYEARQAAQVWFTLKMTADCLNNRPMQTQKALEITGGVK
jgi:hypothetical protein